MQRSGEAGTRVAWWVTDNYLENRRGFSGRSAPLLGFTSLPGSLEKVAVRCPDFQWALESPPV